MSPYWRRVWRPCTIASGCDILDSEQRSSTEDTISRYKMGARSWCERRSQPPPSPPDHQQGANNPETANQQQEELANNSRRGKPPTAPSPGPLEYHHDEQALIATIPTSQPAPEKMQQPKPILRTNSPPLPFESSVMYTASTVKDRQRLEMGLLRDRQVRLNSVQTDILLDLPPAIALPDGEEHRTHTCKLRDANGAGYASVQLIHLRDAEQESEIYRGYIRPPPNRTVPQKEPRKNVSYPQPPPPPYGSTGPYQHLGVSQRTSSTDSDTVALLPRSDSSSSCQQRRGMSRRYNSPPSYSPVGETAVGGTKLKNSATGQSAKSTDGHRTFSEDRADLSGACLGMTAVPDETYEEYSDSPPSYNDIMGSTDFETTGLISRQQSNGV